MLEALRGPSTAPDYLLAASDFNGVTNEAFTPEGPRPIVCGFPATPEGKVRIARTGGGVAMRATNMDY